MELTYLINDSLDPYYNIALEEYLLENTRKEECILYLWQNDKTVVIGRNQNIWKECKIDLLQEDGGHVVRRLSGGGAVYHDLGNLNFTFLVRKENFDIQKQTEVILQAVRYFGLDARRQGRNDIYIDGKKFSGNAFYKSGNYYYHHGTLLIHGSKVDMQKYLTPSLKKLQSNSVDSVQSRVCYLHDYESKITIETMKQALIEAFQMVYGNKANEYQKDVINKEEIKEIKEKFLSWQWTYGKKIEFNTTWTTRFDWGEVEIQFYVNNGIIQEVKVWSDAIDHEIVDKIEVSLKQTRFNQLDMKKSLGELGYLMEAKWDV